MSDVLDRIEAAKKSAIPGRLLRGAEVLGRLWREGQRCLDPWGNGCPCGPKATDFCAVKLKWLGLLIEYYGGHPFGLQGDEPFYVFLAMRNSQWKALGLTAVIEHPGARKPIRYGAGGTDLGTIVDLARLPDTERLEALEAVVTLQEAGF